MPAYKSARLLRRLCGEDERMYFSLRMFTSCLSRFTYQEEESLADIITFRMGRDMVYIPLAKTYAEALQLATQVFPRLAGIDSDQICLTMNVTLRGQTLPVRISPMSWPDVRTHVVQYEILDVAVADKAIWAGIEELQATSPSARGPPPLYTASTESSRSPTSESGVRSRLTYILTVLRLLK